MCRSYKVARVVRVVTLLGLFVVAASSARGAIVSTQYTGIFNGTADFGSGFHFLGDPGDYAVVTFDYDTSSGQLVATARVRGTLYWDALFESGCARLVIHYRDSAAAILSTRQITECGPGGDANQSANQTAVDDSFSHPALTSVQLGVFDTRQAQTFQRTVAAPLTRTYSPNIESGPADFGSFAFDPYLGIPPLGGTLQFLRDDEELTATVNGSLYWQSSTRGCGRAIIDFRTNASAVLFQRTRDLCGLAPFPRFLTALIGESFRSSALFQVRLRVGTVEGGRLTNVRSQTYDFNGLTGNFGIEPVAPVVFAEDPLLYAFTWTVPEPKTWHDLESLHLRITDGVDTILWVRFEEATNSFSVFNEASGQFGRGDEAGSRNRLQTPHAMLHLSAARAAAVNSVLGIGPTSPGVTVSLPITLKPSAAGRTYRVEVAATDDEGNADPFVEAGTLTVLPRQP